MPDTTAKIRAKGLDATGITEEIANQLFAHKGTHHMAIVEFKVDATHETADGKRAVDLVLTQVEPATDDNLAEHLRELNRTLYYNRGAGDQPTLGDGTDEPTVDAVLAAGAKHKPHPFLPVDAAEENPMCDVCGLLEAAGVHSVQEILDQPDDPENPDEPALDVAGDEVDGEDLEDGDDGWEYPEPEGTSTQTPIIDDPFLTKEPAT